MIHDLITTAQLVLYASLAWSAVAGALITSVVVALAGAVTGMWADRGRVEQPVTGYEEAA
ncbi:hypothetical protein ACFRLW_18340 [Streptomyces sp. NPDC056728]|uniref:hypothetical protein n=1 Tax=Paenibacillus chitinolyticus TaxID=79263 RepID=UPI0036722A15